jgi:hypothetical protein
MICPNCKQEATRRRNGACPNCGVEVGIHDGVWYLSGPNSPNLTILKYFEQRVRKHQSALRGRHVPFRFRKKGVGYKQELVAAGRLFKQADYDLELVKDSIDILFSDPDFSWKLRTSMMYIAKDFNLALAIAHTNKQRKEEERAREMDAEERILSRENIFAD